MEKPIMIPIGNEVELRIKPITQSGEPISPLTLSNVVVRMTSAHVTTEYPHTIDPEYVVVTLPASQKQGEYDVHLDANVSGRRVAMHKKALFNRCLFDPDQAVAMATYTTEWVVVSATTSEIDALREALNVAIADALEAEAEARAKAEEYAEALSHLDGIAQEATSQDIKNALGKYGDVYDDHTLHGIVGQFGDVAADKTLFGAVDLARSEATEAKVAAASADLAAQDAKAESVKMTNIFQGWFANVWTPFRQLVEQRLSSIITTLGNVAKKSDLPTDYARQGEVAKTLDDIKVDIPEDIARQGEYDGILNQIKDAVTLTAADADADWLNVEPIIPE